MEKRWLGYPSQTIAGETPLLCIILNSPAAIQRQAFMLVRPCLKLCAGCLSASVGNHVWPYCKEALI